MAQAGLTKAQLSSFTHSQWKQFITQADQMIATFYTNTPGWTDSTSSGGTIQDCFFSNCTTGSVTSSPGVHHYTIAMSDLEAEFFKGERPYLPPPRHFNRYINASDLLEEFITEVGALGVRQSEVLQLPINIFIHWMLMKAAEQDGDPIPDDVLRLEDHAEVRAAAKFPRCRYCGRFIEWRRSRAGVWFCNDNHLMRHLDKQELVA